MYVNPAALFGVNYFVRSATTIMAGFEGSVALVKPARQSGRLASYSKTDPYRMHSFKGMRFSAEIIMICIRWYVAYPLSYRHVEEMMEERGVFLDHATINRWAVRFLPIVEKASRRHMRPMGLSWRMDETYVKVKGVWKYLYRAVDKEGQTIEFLLTAKRDAAAAKPKRPAVVSAVPANLAQWERSYNLRTYKPALML